MPPATFYLQITESGFKLMPLLTYLFSGDRQNDARRKLKFARRLAREKGKEVRDRFVYLAFARQGWMVPNQYWTPGAVSPMPIMGKYYMHYGSDFLPPRVLGELHEIEDVLKAVREVRA